MGMFTSINIAATGMSAERLRTDVISNNIANASTTRTPEGGAFKKSEVIFEPVASDNPTWRLPFVNEDMDNGPGKGVRVKTISKDTSQGRLVYDPQHPDAIQSGPNKGYVEYPNVNNFGVTETYRRRALDGVREMTEADRQRIVAQNQAYSEQGLRVLAFAYKESDEALSVVLEG